MSEQEQIIDPQPDPKKTAGRPIWELVIEDMRARDQFGRQKYSTPLQAHNGRDAAVDAYQEALDLCVYQRQQIAERADYLSRIAELERERDALQQWVSDLQSGMFINCVYCGHRYGPDPGTPVAMADVLKAHVEICPKHPMSNLRVENERLRKIAAYVPAKIYIGAKEKAGFGERVIAKRGNKK